jgi:hypothetical protein
MEDGDELLEISGCDTPGVPVSGKRMFQGDLADSENNACPHWYADGRNWSLIAEGYIKSASILVASVMRREVSPDEMLYPVCFAYRHGLELRLKEIILLGNKLRSGTPETECGHDLDCLWKKARSILAEHVEVAEEILNTMGAQVSELCAIDCCGDEFRYPKTLTKKNSAARIALSNSKHINLRQVRDVMGSIDSVLSGAIGYLWGCCEPNGIGS